MSNEHMCRSRSRSLFAFLLLAAALPVAGSGPVQAAGRPRPVRIMTRNLYLGADLGPAFAAGTPVDLVLAASSVWQHVLSTEFPERARVLADEIEEAEPLLIGLQEVALWRTGVPDGPPALGGSPAEDVVFDFLQILRDELEARAVPYDVVVSQEEADIEAPTILGFDVRLTQRDVILARSGLPADELQLTNAGSAHFLNNLSVSLAGGLVTVTSTRGWTSVDVTAERRSFRLVNAHLEAFSNFYRTVQTLELLTGPLMTSAEVVLIGDLNSDPNDPVFGEPGSPFNGTNPYDLLVATGFSDTWVLANPLAPGPTCCNAADLLNPEPSLTERLDHVLARPGVAVYGSGLVGVDPDGRTPAGLWPSDHAGVIAVLAP